MQHSGEAAVVKSWSPPKPGQTSSTAAPTNSTATTITTRTRSPAEPRSQRESRQTRFRSSATTITGLRSAARCLFRRSYHPQKDKTYFFWSEEWRKASTPGTNDINVPTTGQLGGAFPWILDTDPKSPNYNLYVNQVPVFRTLARRLRPSTAPSATQATL